MINYMKKHYYFAYTLIFIILFVIIFCSFFLKGNSLVHMADGFNQYYPAYIYICRYIRETFISLISGQGIPSFDFSIGFGDDVIGTLNYYGLGELLYLPMAFFPVKYAAYSFSFLTALKLYLSGITFSIYAFRKFHNKYAVLAGSMIYSFSSWALFYGLQFPSMAYAMLLFPLIMAGLDTLLEDNSCKKLSPLFIISLFLQALSGFYFLWADAVFCLIYYLINCFCNFHNWKFFFRKTINILFHSLLGIGMAGILLIPALIAYFNSSRPGRRSLSLQDLLIPNFEILFQQIKHLITPPGYEAGLGLPLLVIISFFGLFYFKKQFRVLKIVFILFLSGYFIPLTGSLMNGLSYSTDRWTYQLFFLSTLVTSCFLSNYQFHKKRTNEILCILCLMNIAMNGFFNNGPVSIGGRGWSACFLSFEDLSQISDSLYARSILPSTDTSNNFYRIDMDDTTINASLIFDNYSTNSYYSITNNSIYEFYTNMLISPSYTGSFCFQGLDKRQSLNMLLSVQKYLDKTIDNTVCDNPYYLPLGFTYDSYVAASELSSTDALLKSHITTDTVILDNVEENFPLKKYDVKQAFDDIQEIPVSWSKSDADHSISIIFDSLSPSTDYEYYVYLSNFAYSDSDTEYFDISVCDKAIRLFPEQGASHDISTYLVKISNNSIALLNGKIELLLPDNSNFTLGDAKLYKLNVSSYANAYEKHRESTLGNVKIEANKVTGTISTDSTKLLFMSIPYSEGWHCYVDGVPAHVYRADYGFSAIILSPGSHEITWSYTTPGNHLGVCLSGIGFICFIFAVIFQNRKKPAD